MRAHPVVFIAFKEFDNLGVGYLASMLSSNGYEPFIIDFRDKKDDILKAIGLLKPAIVGFSVIFQYYIHEFQKLISYLRESGVASHFCAGGQYASLKYNDLFTFIPSLDSIVRFEGEYTFLELVRCIYSGTDWHKIKGIGYKENGNVIVNPVRPPETDLDKLPFPVRSPLQDYALGKKFATIIAGRGCINNCAFCNNTEYIRQSSAPFKRIRKPDKVVEEMEYLYHEKDCSVFLFEDDDFPLKTENGYLWIEKFCKELQLKKLSDKIMWKVNCRPDDVDYDIFYLMRDNGLFLVFLGIDDGTDRGLRRLKKHMTVEESLRGISILKKLKIGLDYGFLLFQPSSTFRSVNENVDFLRTVCSDGYTPVVFLKLIPFFATKIEKELIEERRIKGEPGFPDYNFLDNSLDNYFNFLENSFMEWIYHPDGLANLSKWARNYISVFSHYYKITTKVQLLNIEINTIITQSNQFLLDTMKKLASVFECGKFYKVKKTDLTNYRVIIKEKHDQFREQIIDSVKEVGHFAEYQRLEQFINF